MAQLGSALPSGGRGRGFGFRCPDKCKNGRFRCGNGRFLIYLFLDKRVRKFREIERLRVKTWSNVLHTIPIS